MSCVMGHNYRRFNFVSIAFPVFMSITLFHASVFVPLVGLLSPAPLYFASVFNGRRNGLYIIGLACVATAFLSGVSGALVYLLSTGLMTWAPDAPTRLKISIIKT